MYTIIVADPCRGRGTAPAQKIVMQDRDTLIEQSVKYSNRTVTACNTKILYNCL